jgi:hypothetical protein
MFYLDACTGHIRPSRGIRSYSAIACSILISTPGSRLPYGKFLLIYVCNFHVLSHLLLIYIYKLHWKQGPLEINANNASDGHQLVNLTDYSSLATHTWVDGLRFAGKSTFRPPYLPSLIKIGNKSTIGYRPHGSIEKVLPQLKRIYPKMVLNKDVLVDEVAVVDEIEQLDASLFSQQKTTTTVSEETEKFQIESVNRNLPINIAISEDREKAVDPAVEKTVDNTSSDIIDDRGSGGNDADDDLWA